MEQDVKNYVEDVVRRSFDGLKATIGQSVQDQSPDIKLLNQALSKSQGKLVGALKDKKNPFFGSDYADLEAIWSVARIPLAEHGLAVTQTPCKDGTHLITTLTHDSGQWIKGFWPILADKKNSQGFMGAVTYARRGALSSMVGVHTTDDDGNESSGLDTDNPPSPDKKITDKKSKIGSVKTPKAKSTSSEAESDKIVKMVREVMDEGAEKLSEGKVQSLERRVSKLSDENQKKFLHDMSIDACSSLRKDEFTQASKTLSKLERAS